MQHTCIRCKLGIGIALDSITNRLSFSSDETRKQLLRAAEEMQEVTSWKKKKAKTFFTLLLECLKRAYLNATTHHSRPPRAAATWLS